MATVAEDIAQPEPESETAVEQPLISYLAEFAGPNELMAAAEKVRDTGFTKFDCFSPFPIHGIDDAMGTERTRLPFIVLGAAATGGLIAISMQLFMNGFQTPFNDIMGSGHGLSGYPYIISGKPLFSFPSSMPVVFELCVLFSAFAALLGMLALNGLPQLYNALFHVQPFLGVTQGKFFLGIEAADPQFDETRTKEVLESLSPMSIDECRDTGETRMIPKEFFIVVGLLGVVALVPLVVVLQLIALPSNVPRMHPVQDMDNQAKIKAQQFNAFFTDGRGMRPSIPGTIARGNLQEDPEMYRGLQAIPETDEIDDATLLPNAKDADGEAVKLDGLPWVTELPDGLEADKEFLHRGQERYKIYCAPCHGLGGYGDGLVSNRAMQLMETGKSAWVKPVSFHTDPIRMQPIGQLFNTVKHGVRKMPGYGSQIPPKDRWAIVMYLKALQRSQSASIEDVPEDLRESLPTQESVIQGTSASRTTEEKTSDEPQDSDGKPKDDDAAAKPEGDASTTEEETDKTTTE